MALTIDNCNLCLICGTKVFFGEDISLIKSRKNSCSKFLTLVSRYLNLNFKFPSRDFHTTAEELKSLNTNRNKESICCFTCLYKVLDFCDNYQKLEELEIKIILIVENISKLLATVSKDNSKFSEEFASSVKRKRIRRFPCLKLQKLCSKDRTLCKDEKAVVPDFSVTGGTLRIIVKTIDAESIKKEISEDKYQIEESCDPSIDNDAVSFDSSTFEEEGNNFKTGSVKMETPRSLVDNNDLKDAAEQKQIYTSKNKKRTHKKRFRTWYSHKCLMCQKEFRKLNVLEDHIRLLHTNEKPFNCRICKKSYSSKTHLNEHRRSHPIINSTICNLCGIGFVNQDQLKQHQILHSDEGRKFSCKICLKSFKRRAGLSRHELFVHVKRRKERAYECNICGQKFVTKASMQTHIKRTHGDEKNNKTFKCPHTPCKYACYTNAKLIIHIRTHTGERPFKCDRCGFAYRVKEHLRRHLERTHM